MTSRLIVWAACVIAAVAVMLMLANSGYSPITLVLGGYVVGFSQSEAFDALSGLE